MTVQPTDVEINTAYSYLPYARAKVILSDDEKEFTDAEANAWLRWACSQDPKYDWTFRLIAFQVPSYHSECLSYDEAHKRLQWFLSTDIDDVFGGDVDRVISAIIFWLEDKEQEYENLSTWCGVSDMHYMKWTREEGGNIHKAYDHGKSIILYHLCGP